MRPVVVGVALLCIGLSGCPTAIDVPDGVFACTADEDCPPEFECGADARCHSLPDGGVRDAAADAPDGGG